MNYNNHILKQVYKVFHRLQLKYHALCDMLW